jgi:hypothetical protein
MRSSLEGQARLEPAVRQPNEKPSQAVVAFEHALRNAAAAGLRETVGEKREVALRYQFRSSRPPSVPRATHSREDAKPKRSSLRLAALDRAARRWRSRTCAGEPIPPARRRNHNPFNSLASFGIRLQTNEDTKSCLAWFSLFWRLFMYNFMHSFYIGVARDKKEADSTERWIGDRQVAARHC